MQALFSTIVYDRDMTKAVSRLKELRETAGLSQRELARRVGQDQSNIRYWETTGKPPRSDVLVPLARELGVTVEELLGLPKPRNNGKPGGRLGEVVERISRMPRRQRDRVVGIVETVIAGEEAKS
jgi:transcriptional regulator with XRE-family HTH domain